MKVDFVDLNAQYQEVKQEIDDGLKEVIKKGNFILGEEVKQFEEVFAGYCGRKFGVGLNSGTDALFLGLLSLGIGKDDEVIVPAFTYIASALAVSYTGAKVVFADIDEETYDIDARKLKSLITKKTRAIMPVHLYGQPADMEELLALAKEHDLKVVEDTAQAHGAEYKGKRAGSLGDIGCFSFYPTKNLGAFGDGGMVTTDNPEVYRKLLMLRDYGRKDRYEHSIKGYNSRLDTVQAVILKAKLKYVDKWNKMRQENARAYNQLFAGRKEVIIPAVKNGRIHVYHVYGVRVKNRDRVYEAIRNNGVGALIHYPIPLHLQAAYSELGYKKGDFPVAEKVAGEIISLPMHPFLKPQEMEYVAGQVLKAGAA
jgi:dTDP-4-amino-4,6-dideoxygalactose transaminase